jgi:predicted transglutaminase-like cysteine proteinase
MLPRVAAWSFAVFLVVWPAACAVETDTLPNADAPLAAPAIATTHDQLQSEAEDKIGVPAEVPARKQDQTQRDGAPNVAALAPAEPTVASPPVAEPFGLAAVPVASGDIVTKWSVVEADIRAENEILARCRETVALCSAAARSFLAIVAEGRAQTGRARIGVINRAINLAIEPMSDLAQWGVPDRWSAPLETFGTGRGDCEDYAIAKYVALTAAGVAAEDVRLVIVRNIAIGEDHAVAAVHLDGNWIMLDNRWLTLVEDVAMPKVIPRFVLDRDGVRQFAAPALAARPTSAPASFGF